MMTLDSTVDQHTRVGLVGDTCQVKTALRTLKCTATLHGSPESGLSAVNWILSRLIHVLRLMSTKTKKHSK